MKILIHLWKVMIILAISLMITSCLKAPQFDVMLSESQKTVSENDGSVEVTFVLPDGPINNDIEISYRFGGTAKEGKDFTSREEDYIFIPKGQTSVSFSITLIDNNEQDGQKTIVVAILLVISNGNTIFQGAERQSLTILVEDDDCSPFIGGEWDYKARYFMHSYGDTVMVAQNSEPLGEGLNPEFTGVVTLTEIEGYKNYMINDMFVGMFSDLDIITPSLLHDNCGILTGPNDGTVLLMGTLPSTLSGILVDDNTMNLIFKYINDDITEGGFGQAVLTRKI